MIFIFSFWGVETSKIKATNATKKDIRSWSVILKAAFFLLQFFLLSGIKEAEEGRKLNFYLNRFLR